MNKLHHIEVRAIRTWLKSAKSKLWATCPFLENWEGRCLVCRAIFPKLARKQVEENYETGCPCYLYSKSYVVRRARLILARHGRV